MRTHWGVALGAAALTVILAGSDQSMAAGATALALPPDIAAQGVSIFTAIRPTEEAAKEAALAGCRENSSSDTLKGLCKVVATFSNQCVAQALDPKDGTPGFGWAVASNADEAKKQALANCRATAGPNRQDACQVDTRSLWCDGSAKSSVQAQNQLTSFKGKSFDLAIPSGFCVADSSSGLSKRLTALINQAGNTTVKIAADCRELAAQGFDAKNRIYNYIAYYYANSSEKEVLDGDVQARRKAVCNDELRAQQTGEMKEVPDLVAKTAQELQQKLAQNNTQYLGVVGEDTHGCYGELLSNISTGPNDHYLMDTHVLLTVIHGRSLWVALYSKYESPAESDEMLTREQALAAELDSKNPD